MFRNIYSYKNRDSEDKLSYFFNVDETLLVEVPKIIIQPIVENSIYHGIKIFQKMELLKSMCIKKITQSIFQLKITE